MTKAKQQVIDMLRDIPDDKVVHILEMMRGFMLLYSTDDKSMATIESAPTAMGIFNKHANPALIPKEKGAWGEAIREKYANN
ncbi:MAG: hypothetical protein FWG53_02470 [Clostridiales bacterium]|nr:hypothetical protein [Clostridiales bacterium]